jgi:hypothetical protein
MGVGGLILKKTVIFTRKISLESKRGNDFLVIVGEMVVNH